MTIKKFFSFLWEDVLPLVFLFLVFLLIWAATGRSEEKTPAASTPATVAVAPCPDLKDPEQMSVPPKGMLRSKTAHLKSPCGEVVDEQSNKAAAKLQLQLAKLEAKVKIEQAKAARPQGCSWWMGCPGYGYGYGGYGGGYWSQGQWIPSTGGGVNITWTSGGGYTTGRRR